MPRRSLLALLLVVSLWPALAQTAPSQTAPSQKERHFTFHYAFALKNVNRGERVRVWIPLAHSDAFQDVKVASRSGDLPLKLVRQPEYGNEVLHAEISKADKSEYRFSVDYDVVRREHVVLVEGKPVDGAPFGKAPRVELARFLEADR